MALPRAVLFDLDETLAESFQSPTPRMLMLFEQLLSYTPVALITGASMKRVTEHVLSALSPSADVSRFFILPDSSAEAYHFEEGIWKQVYAHTFSEEERANVVSAIERVCASHGWNQYPVRGERILSRPSQITVAALGIQASDDEKMNFDLDRSKREAFRDDLQLLFPDLEVRVGGRTAIDVSPRGLDKAHGVTWLAERLSCQPKDMLYIGDSFHPGGNDEAVVPTGIQWKSVAGPHETEVVIEELLHLYATTPLP